MSIRFKLLLSCVFLMLLGLACPPKPDLPMLTETYLREHARFYPARAFSMGMRAAAWHFGNYDNQQIENWVKLNEKTVSAATMFEAAATNIDDRLTARILLQQAEGELERWLKDKPVENSPSFYSGQISGAMTTLLVRDQLTPAEKFDAAMSRLGQIREFCDLGVAKLVNGSPIATESSLGSFQRTAAFYRDTLPNILDEWDPASQTEKTKALCAQTADSIDMLAKHVRENVLPVVSLPDQMGEEAYYRKHKLYTGLDILPDQLSEMALKEIDTVRALMVEESRAWWSENRADQTQPDNENDFLKAVMEAMEEDRLDNQADFLTSFTDLTKGAEDFLIDNDLAYVPLPRTLFIGMSPPHFAGAAVGGVYSAGPYDPVAQTLFYLPSIPDDAPEQAKEGFYRSFNNHFNTMIIAHEMYPGHYMQYKVANNHAPKVRTLFGNGVYVEGWGSFCEILTLDAGWGDGNRLTRLAHFRKRLENATRAYTSVMVHTKGWTKDQLTEFAVDRGLLAPQFAINLWSRVIRSPLQLTTYFLGFHDFVRLYEAEQNRLGDAFSTKEFIDSVLKVGPVPTDVLPELVRAHIDNKR